MSTLKVVRLIIAEGLYPNTKTRVDGLVPIRLYHEPGTAPRVIMPNTFSLELRYFDTNLSRVACHLTMLLKIEPVLFFILSSPRLLPAPLPRTVTTTRRFGRALPRAAAAYRAVMGLRLPNPPPCNTHRIHLNLRSPKEECCYVTYMYLLMVRPTSNSVCNEM